MNDNNSIQIHKSRYNNACLIRYRFVERTAGSYGIYMRRVYTASTYHLIRAYGVD